MAGSKARTRRGSSRKGDALLDSIVSQYLSSGDFNGLPGHFLKPSEQAQLAVLVERGDVTMEFGDRNPNPHIKSFAEEPCEVQLAKLKTLGTNSACMYPGRAVLASRVPTSRYAGRPYEMALALGSGQLEVRYFDLAVLEPYRSDPRFLYQCDDVGGRFSPTDGLRSRLPSKHQVHIQDFGFAYTRSEDRAVAAFFRYLAGLGPEHQQVWQAHELAGEGWLPHPGWWAASMGEWRNTMPLFVAFIEELKVINAMCQAIGWPRMFLEDFGETPRPADFAFVLRPTLAAFNSFVLVLDKVMSDNLSKPFFRAQGLETERERERSDGKVLVEQKGTIGLLEEWLRRRFRTTNEEPLRELVAAFKEVRELRRKPAHALDENRFDHAYYKQQRELVLRAYASVRTIRLALAKHPKARVVEVPGWLFEGDIYPF